LDYLKFVHLIKRGKEDEWTWHTTFIT
jgi:hypothetical protein